MTELDFNKEKIEKLSIKEKIIKYKNNSFNKIRFIQASDLTLKNTKMETSIYVALVLIVYSFLVRYFGSDVTQVINNLRDMVLSEFIYFFVILIIIFTLLIIIFFTIPITGTHTFGGKHATSDISFFGWISRIFCAGIGGNFIYLAYYEPFYFYDSPYFKGFSDIQRGITSSIFHRGFNVWIFYCVAGLPLAYYHHTKKLPLLPRTYLYPILKDKIYCKLGDVVDIIVAITIFFTIANYFVFTTEGVQEFIRGNVVSSYRTLIQIFITIVMAIFFIEVFRRGLKFKGSKVPQIFILLMFITLMFFFITGPTMQMIMNFIQSIVIYIKYAPGTMVNLTNYYENFPTIVMEKTMYNFVFWCSCSMCIGIYFAKISYGRTVREYILASLIIPGIYILITYVIFGTMGANVLLESDYLVEDFLSSMESGLLLVINHYLKSDILKMAVMGIALFMAAGFIFIEITASLISINTVIIGNDKEKNPRKTVITFILAIILIVILYYSDVDGAKYILSTHLIFSVIIGILLLIGIILLLYQAVKDILYLNVYMPTLGYKEREVENRSKYKFDEKDEIQRIRDSDDDIKDIDDIVFTEQDNILNINVNNVKDRRYNKN